MNRSLQRLPYLLMILLLCAPLVAGGTGTPVMDLYVRKPEWFSGRMYVTDLLYRKEREVEEPRFLPRLPESRRRRIALAVVVPAHLEPRVEPAVMVEEHAPRPGADDEGAPGDVARREERAGEAGRFAVDEGERRRDVPRFLVPLGRMRPQRVGEAGAGRVVGEQGPTLAASRPLRHDAPP
jgi:hypothetical protein